MKKAKLPRRLLRYCTFMAVSPATDLLQVQSLSQQFPMAEWGFIFEESQQGPGVLSWLKQTGSLLTSAGAGTLLALGPKASTQWLLGKNLPLLEAACFFNRLLIQPAWEELLEQLATPSEVREVLSRWHQAHASCIVVPMAHWARAPAALRRSLERLPFLEVLCEGATGTPPAVPRLGYRQAVSHNQLVPDLMEIARRGPDEPFWIQLDVQVTDSLGQLDLVRCRDCLVQAQNFECLQAHARRQLSAGQAQTVAQLEGAWLDWWVSTTQGVELVVPSSATTTAVRLCRRTGQFLSWAPSSDPALAVSLMAKEHIVLEPLSDGDWLASPKDAPLCRTRGSSMSQAGLRAIVARHRGLAPLGDFRPKPV